MSAKPIIFISYSHRDKKAKDFIVGHLSVLEEYGELQFWHDRDMAGGDTWKDEIDQRLRSCSVAVILVSKNSLTSEFILKEELKVHAGAPSS